MSKIERVDGLYMTLVTIQVENGLFRVPLQMLQSQCNIFRDMFSLPATEDAEGSSDDNPIQLNGVTKREFQRFLEVLFSNPYKENPEAAFEEVPFDMWFPVLKLARMWECNIIHKHAVEHMSYELVSLSPAEKLGLAVKYDIQPWLLPGVNELARRNQPLGKDDLVHLGAELALKVAAVRESFFLTRGHGRCNCGSAIALGVRDASCSSMDFTPIIKRVFQLE